MADKTEIAWCDSTFNPWIGCTKVSPACDHCYAQVLMDQRMGRAKWGAGHPRARTSADNWKQPLRWNARGFYACANCGGRNDGRDGMDRDGAGTWKCKSCGSERLNPTRRRVFCASLADVFDNEVPPQWRADLFKLIGDTSNLDWLLLTKRVGNVARMIPFGWQEFGMPPNIWIGATICNQSEADRDVPKLLRVPARVRFLSIEPMLGPIDLRAARALPLRAQLGFGDQVLFDGTLPAVNWVIVGGESGPKARPMHPDWPRSLRDQCASAGVALHFKQHGEWACAGTEPIHPKAARLPGNLCRIETPGQPDRYSAVSYDGRTRYRIERVGKPTAGRLLDGRTHDEFPGADGRKG